MMITEEEAEERGIIEDIICSFHDDFSDRMDTRYECQFCVMIIS